MQRVKWIRRRWSSWSRIFSACRAWPRPHMPGWISPVPVLLLILPGSSGQSARAEAGVKVKVSVESLTSLLTGGATAMTVMAIFLVLILAGKLHTDAEFQREAQALDREKMAHDETRKALVEAAARGDAAVRATELVARALGHSSHQGGEIE